MTNIQSLCRGGILLGLIALSSACVVAGPGYHEGYYDHEHHRYWHENGWRECGGERGERDEHCR